MWMCDIRTKYDGGNVTNGILRVSASTNALYTVFQPPTFPPNKQATYKVMNSTL
jgi:hypothetical protein